MKQILKKLKGIKVTRLHRISKFWRKSGTNSIDSRSSLSKVIEFANTFLPEANLITLSATCQINDPIPFEATDFIAMWVLFDCRLWINDYLGFAAFRMGFYSFQAQFTMWSCVHSIKSRYSFLCSLALSQNEGNFPNSTYVIENRSLNLKIQSALYADESINNILNMYFKMLITKILVNTYIV